MIVRMHGDNQRSRFLDRAGVTLADNANPAPRRRHDPDLTARDFAPNKGLHFGKMGLRLKGFPSVKLPVPASSPRPFFRKRKSRRGGIPPKVLDHIGLLVYEPPGLSRVAPRLVVRPHPASPIRAAYT